jgi:hypothetical protein
MNFSHFQYVVFKGVLEMEVNKALVMPTRCAKTLANVPVLAEV